MPKRNAFSVLAKVAGRSPAYEFCFAKLEHFLQANKIEIFFAAKNIESYFFSNFFDFVKKTFIPSSGNFSFMAFIIALTFSASDFFT